MIRRLGIAPRPALVVLALLLAALVGFLYWQRLQGPAIGDIIRGGAQIVDGDTIRIQGRKVRLWGIEAAERGEDGFAEARDFLAELVAGHELACEVISRQRAIGHYEARWVAQCFRSLPGGEASDIAAEMVAAGYAVDSPAYSGGYYAPEVRK